MTPKLLLAKAITLLYRESHLGDGTDRSVDLVRDIIGLIQLPEVSVGYDREKEVLEGMRSTALYMANSPSNVVFDKSDTLQRIKIVSMEDKNVYDAIKEGIETELSENEQKRTCVSIRRSLKEYLREETVKEIVSTASYNLKFGKVANIKDFISNLYGKLEPFMTDVVSKDPAIIGEVNTNNIGDLINVYNNVDDTGSSALIMRTGFQTINRMFDGGLRRGKTYVTGALQHQFKTGFSLTLFKQLALYNKPVMTDPTKKPALVRITAEDDLNDNFNFLYYSLRENELREPIVGTSYANVSKEEKAAYVKEKLAVNGYETIFIHINPSLWGYRELCNKIIELESEGYEIHAVMLDYLYKLNKSGCDGGIAGQDVFNQYERVRNFMAAKKILFLTPHQLSTDAKMMIREGRTGFVKELPGKGFYMGSKQIDQVVDGELFQHIEKVNGKSYLTLQRGKHRHLVQVDDKYLYAVLPFQDKSKFMCGLFDDVNGEDSSLTKVGATKDANGVEQAPFWEVD